jgi:hypothetical protein
MVERSVRRQAEGLMVYVRWSAITVRSLLTVGVAAWIETARC